MKQIELALVLKTIDAHARAVVSLHAPTSFVIDNPEALKAELCKLYEVYMKEDEDVSKK